MTRLILVLSLSVVSATAHGTKCAHWLTASLLLVKVTAASAAESTHVPTQSERLETSSGFVTYPDFPHLEIVTESDGRPNEELAAAITDPVLKRQIDQQYFTSLQVRNPAVYKPGVKIDGDFVTIPLVASIKYREGQPGVTNCNRGTINVAGTARVRLDKDNLAVTVERIEDSWFLESWGRHVGCHADVDLRFAQKVLPPVLESWLNHDPARIETLLDIAGVAPNVARP